MKTNKSKYAIMHDSEDNMHLSIEMKTKNDDIFSV